MKFNTSVVPSHVYQDYTDILEQFPKHLISFLISKLFMSN